MKVKVTMSLMGLQLSGLPLVYTVQVKRARRSGQLQPTGTWLCHSENSTSISSRWADLCIPQRSRVPVPGDK